MGDGFLAVDWGTTNRRVYHIEHGRVLATKRDDLGARMVRPDAYPSEVAAIRARFGDLPMLLAGMVGSTIGWREVPYLSLPTGLETLARALHRIDDRTAIVPGLVQRSPADVMRGEEVQLLGAGVAGMVPRGGALCQPGTHCKWARLDSGRITGFSTSMTGELFGLLREHSILAPQLGGAVHDGPAFREGVKIGAAEGVQTALFRIRARAVIGGLDTADGASFASGVLIGQDASHHIGSAPLGILGDEILGGLYRTAIEILGGVAEVLDSNAAFVAGISRIQELSQ